ncbi:class I SAM-dependent methyltransferase [Micrococcus luteus]|uniref:class I SAM-dependent methyltransferase n=1 Tax=Micrococcus luteus TaxID=1270 RepID=UPI0020CBC6DB|nr:class I SAM-dependent methyltransferase [Micrococcus luteus]UTT45478.1 class I SAM-dependent methyltransferase [Micrococcus luteus]
MSGNVAMHLIGQDWHDALRRIAAGLVPGGRLLFETRNPVRRAWEDWQQEPTERTTAAGRLVESEAKSTPDADGVVVHRWRTEYSDEGVDRVWSDWHGRPFDAAEHPLMIIEACPQGA